MESEFSKTLMLKPFGRRWDCIGPGADHRANSDMDISAILSMGKPGSRQSDSFRGILHQM